MKKVALNLRAAKLVMLWVCACVASVFIGYVGFLIAGWNGLLDLGADSSARKMVGPSVFSLIVEPFDSQEWKKTSDQNSDQLLEHRRRMCTGLIQSVHGLKRNEVFLMLGTPDKFESANKNDERFSYDVGHGDFVLHFRNDVVTNAELIDNSDASSVAK